jgi:hypothetical protein
MRIAKIHARRVPMIATTAAAALGACAVADFIGWTATRRQVTGGHLINVFAVTNDPTDVILNVSGGTAGTPNAGFILTNSPGGFLQGAGALSVFAPSGSQNWTTLDSFLTRGGGFNTTTNAWLATSSTQGDPPWNVTYVDTDIGENVTVNGFNTPNNASGFTNPWTNAIPPTGGWFTGSQGPPRSLASLTTIRFPYQRVSGINYGASSAAAAAATHGYLVAQLYVSEWGFTSGGYRHIDWKMRATLKRTDGSTSSATFEFRIGEVCVGDLTDDRFINGADLGMLLNAWGSCVTSCPADLTSDGVVDGSDLGTLLASWGPCPS